MREPVLAKRIGELGRRRIEQECDVEKVMGCMIAHIRSNLADQEPGRGFV
jgi:hypothetical protein